MSEITITPEMMEAGLKAIRRHGREVSSSEWGPIIEDVFKAMYEAIPEPNPDNGAIHP